MEHDQTKALTAATELCGCNSLKSFMRRMNTKLMEYLGFTDINIMFLDPEKSDLYTITFGDDLLRLEITNYWLSKAKTK
jgi:hypothetical protein